jgi:hypothetical protein
MPQIANLPGLVLDRAHPLSRGLVGWWPMNEGGGAGLRDMVTGAVSVGVNTAASWRIGSPLGAGVLLDGTDDYAAFSVAQVFAGWSMSAWVRPDAWQGSAPYERSIMGSYTNPPYARLMFGGGGSSGNQARLSVDNGYATLTTTVDQTLAKWIHVVGTCDAVAQKCYVNGALIGSGAGGTMVSTVGTYHIGAVNALGRYFSGGMAHARFYGRVLDAREAAELYVNPMAGARAPFSIARTFIGPPRPSTADRLHNRRFRRIYRRGES